MKEGRNTENNWIPGRVESPAYCVGKYSIHNSSNLLCVKLNRFVVKNLYVLGRYCMTSTRELTVE